METSSPGLDFSTQVAAAAGRLSRQERLVVEYLVTQPQRAVTASTAELAAATKTSEATVVRSARSLGYAGLRELKRSLIAEIADPRDQASVLSHRLRQAGTRAGSVLDQLLEDAARLLAQVPEELDQSAWSQCVDILDAADQIWIYGVGASAAVAEHHALQLTRSDRKARAITFTGPRLADPLLEIQPDDAVLIYAPVLHFHEIDVLIRHATRVGAPSVLVTQALEEELVRQVDVVLNLPQAAATTVHENVLDLLLAHGLTLELASRDQVNALRARHELIRLRNELSPGLETKDRN